METVKEYADTYTSYKGTERQDYTSNENSKFPRILKDVVTFWYQERANQKCIGSCKNRFFCYTDYKFE